MKEEIRHGGRAETTKEYRLGLPAAVGARRIGNEWWATVEGKRESIEAESEGGAPFSYSI